MIHLVRMMLLAVLAYLLGGLAPSAVAIPEPSAQAVVHAYDAQPHNARGHGVSSECGPPAWVHDHTAYDPVDHWSRGAATRSDATAGGSTTTYTLPVQFVQVAEPAATTNEPAKVSEGDFSAFERLQVAANNVPTVTFSRSRAPGIAQNFDIAVANGAPTRLNRVDAATRNANRRAALRGQSPAPAGQSLDEYPFACSAQGGCGSFVRSVPVGEQSYQGGVLSQFFQRSGIQPGDPFDVMFGP